MHLLLTFYLVIMSFNLGRSNEAKILDLSDRCKNGRKILLRLTTGMGQSDLSVSMIANHYLNNCTLIYQVSPENYVMLNVEFPDQAPGETICKGLNDSIHMVSDRSSIDLCRQNLDTNEVRHNLMLNRRNVNLDVRSAEGTGTIKIVATAMRRSKYAICVPHKEVPCTYDNEVFCMPMEALCDGNINCGSYDEDLLMCGEFLMDFEFILNTLLMGVLSFLLILSIVVIVVPKRKETFIYRLDDAMSLFDNEQQKTIVDIDITIVFSEIDQMKPQVLKARRKSILEKSFRKS